MCQHYFGCNNWTRAIHFFFDFALVDLVWMIGVCAQHHLVKVFIVANKWIFVTLINNLQTIPVNCRGKTKNGKLLGVNFYLFFALRCNGEEVVLC